MYRILLVKDKRDNYGSIYQYLTHTVDGVTKPVEFLGKADLDAYVEEMLNVQGYAKSDFIIVNEVEYGVKADIDEKSE